VSRAVCPQPFTPPDGEGGFDAVNRASRPVCGLIGAKICWLSSSKHWSDSSTSGVHGHAHDVCEGIFASRS
jgi:hypothetical protein